MKITDTTGRSMLVDLVYHNPQVGWLKPPSCELQGRKNVFCRLPHGRYAIRICSVTGADVILFEDGRKLIETSVPAQTQIIEFDAQRNALQFVAEGNERPTLQATDEGVAESLSDDERLLNEAIATQEALAPTGHGLVFAVVRFAKQNNPYGEPPQEEFEVGFQMLTESNYDQFFADNFRLVQQPPALPNALDPFSHEEVKDTRPVLRCSFRNCDHHNH